MGYQMKCPPLRRLIDYVQEKQANIELKNMVPRMIAKQSHNNIQNNQNNLQTLCNFAYLGKEAQKTNILRPQKLSGLQKTIFYLTNKLDKIIVDPI